MLEKSLLLDYKIYLHFEKYVTFHLNNVYLLHKDDLLSKLLKYGISGT